MTIEQKAKRYDETLKAAVVAHKDEDRHLKAALERIFPELKESEDERIRKALIDYFDDANKAAENPLQSYGIHTDKAIAWLEKQDKQNPCETCEEPRLNCQNFPCERKNNFKPADKVEPKFKVGDWVVQENIGVYKVIEVCESWYEVVDNKDKHYSIGFDKEYMCHLWTIDDAKDGDVIASDLCDSIILFKGINDDNNIDYYCDYDFSEFDVPGDRFSVNNGQHYGNVEVSEDFHPATKEQRDTLMKAMTDAGYTFDFDKKELKKIEQKSTWSEEDEKEVAVLEAYIRSNDWSDRHIDRALGIVDELVNKIKFLKPQNHWKPTEPQLVSLTIACDRNDRVGFDLTQLLKELKEL